jgi:hypothetical protein
MDASHASNIVAAANSVTIRIDGARVPISSLTPAQLDLVRTCRARTGTWAFARRYLKAQEELRAVEKLQRSLPAASLLDVQAPELEHAAEMSSPSAPLRDSLALVPFIPTAPPNTPVHASHSDHDLSAWLSHALHAYLAFCSTSWAWTAYKVVLRCLWRLVLYIPLVAMWMLLCYFLLAVCFVLSHPEVLVSAAFKLLDSVPSYTKWVGERLFEQLSLELTDRLR